MTAWTVATVVLIVAGAAPAAAVAARGGFERRLIGYELLQIVAVCIVLCFANVANRTSYFDVALVLAVLSPAAALVFTKFHGSSE